MQITERGVMNTSMRFFFTPSALAQELFYYAKRLGHYYCTTDYRFNCRHEIAQQGDHNQNYMIFVVRSGALQLQLDGQSMQVSAGQVCVFDCRHPYAYRATQNTEFIWLLCNGLNTARFYTQIRRMHGNVLPDSCYAAIDQTLSHLLDRCTEELRPTEAEISQMLHCIWCNMLVRSVPAQNASHSPIFPALQYMNLHYSEPLRVDDLARLCRMSSSHFSRTFKLQTGHSPYEYLLLRRLNRAKQLLVDSTMTVEEIAYAVGYTGPEHFIHSFRGRVGQSPGRFRTIERRKSAEGRG